LIDTHIAPSAIARVPLQSLTTSHLESFYAQLKLKPASVTVIHAIIGRALRTAVRDKILTTNVGIGTVIFADTRPIFHGPCHSVDDALLGADHRRRWCPADHAAWSAAHNRDVAPRCWCAGASRRAASWSL